MSVIELSWTAKQDENIQQKQEYEENKDSERKNREKEKKEIGS